MRTTTWGDLKLCHRPETGGRSVLGSGPRRDRVVILFPSACCNHNRRICRCAASRQSSPASITGASGPDAEAFQWVVGSAHDLPHWRSVQTGNAIASASLLTFQVELITPYRMGFPSGNGHTEDERS